MIAAAIIQNAYNDLYKQLRNYIWEYDTVVKIADLEVAAYMAFPDISKVRWAYNQLASDVSTSDIWSDDKDLQKAFDNFEEKLDGADAIYYGLFVPEEVVNTDIPDADIDISVEEEIPDREEEVDYADNEESESEFTDENAEEE